MMLSPRSRCRERFRQRQKLRNRASICQPESGHPDLDLALSGGRPERQRTDRPEVAAARGVGSITKSPPCRGKRRTNWLVIDT